MLANGNQPTASLSCARFEISFPTSAHSRTARSSLCHLADDRHYDLVIPIPPVAVAVVVAGSGPSCPYPNPAKWLDHPAPVLDLVVSRLVVSSVSSPFFDIGPTTAEQFHAVFFRFGQPIGAVSRT